MPPAATNEAIRFKSMGYKQIMILAHLVFF